MGERLEDTLNMPTHATQGVTGAKNLGFTLYFSVSEINLGRPEN